MNAHDRYANLEVGYDIPAKPGMDEADIQTPCLILDLDALERNITKMGDYAKAHGMRHRVHGKMHKSVDVAKLQEKLGGAVGVCCQKVSEAEVFVRGGIKDVLVSNQVRDPLKIDRLAQLPKLGSRIIVCVDDIANVTDLSAAAVRHGTELEVFIEIDCGAGRCGVTTTEAVVAIDHRRSRALGDHGHARLRIAPAIPEAGQILPQSEDAVGFVSQQIGLDHQARDDVGVLFRNIVVAKRAGDETLEPVGCDSWRLFFTHGRPGPVPCARTRSGAGRS